MTDHTTTPVPDASSSKVGWIVVVALIIVGMFAAGFLLDAGKVYVVSQEQSWTEYESSLSDVDFWLPAGSRGERELAHYGASVSEARMLSSQADVTALVKEARVAFSEEARGSVSASIDRGTSVEMVRMTGSVTFTGWLPTGQEPAGAVSSAVALAS